MDYALQGSSRLQAVGLETRAILGLRRRLQQQRLLPLRPRKQDTDRVRFREERVLDILSLNLLAADWVLHVLQHNRWVNKSTFKIHLKTGHGHILFICKWMTLRQTSLCGLFNLLWQCWIRKMVIAP